MASADPGSDKGAGGDGGSEAAEPASNKACKVIDLNKKRVVFAGILSRWSKQEAGNRAKAYGCIVEGTMTKVTDVVIIGQHPGAVEQKAEDLGVKCLEEDDWDELLNHSKPVYPSLLLKRKSSTDKSSQSDKPVRLTHSMSLESNDGGSKKPAMPQKRRSFRLFNSTKNQDEDAPPAKKAKPANPDTEGKKKCKYWDLCFRKDAGHLKSFLHPDKKGQKPVKADDDDDDKEKASTSKKPKCKYGAKCYRKDPAHKKGFLHPGDPGADEADDEDGEEEEEGRSTRGKPKKLVGVANFPKKKPPGKQRFTHKQVSVLLAHKYDEGTCNPKGWWVSEKLDGVRAFWDGKCFYSRLGNAFLAPRWFTKDLPTDMTLDGELFGGRGLFQSTVKIVKNAECDDYKKIKYFVFDTQSYPQDGFEKRMEALKKYFDSAQPEYAKLVEQTKCISKEQMEQDMKKVIKMGGEGLMLRQPGSKYEKSRSHTLLKVKKFYDAEAVVIGYEPGKGRWSGGVGALRCRMECGKEFKVGSGLKDADHRKPPKIGTIISYKFQEYTNSGSPRFPSYLGIRIDMDGPKDADVPKKPTDDTV